jgi:hypothetical protein
MSHLLASHPLQLREITPVYFVPIGALLILLMERELIRTRPGMPRTVAHHVIDFAIVPLVSLFLIFVGLRAVTMLG